MKHWITNVYMIKILYSRKCQYIPWCIQIYNKIFKLLFDNDTSKYITNLIFSFYVELINLRRLGGRAIQVNLHYLDQWNKYEKIFLKAGNIWSLLSWLLSLFFQK